MFSIIIPVFNEEKRIPKNAEEIFSYFKNIGVQYEIIFVNDGSSDGTVNILENLKDAFNCTIVSYAENHGKGYAIRQGVNVAKGDWIVFFDIDLATPLEEFSNLLSYIREDDEVIIGSRRIDGATIAKSESFIRTFLGQGFTRLSNLLVPGVTDFTCGFKCFSRDAAKEIFSRARIDRWGFDTELLYIAHILNISIREMPIRWTHDADSRVNVLKSVISSFHELCLMVLNNLRGFYR